MNMNKESDILETTLAIAERQYLEAYHFFAECLSGKPAELRTTNIIFPCLSVRWSQYARGGFGMAAQGNPWITKWWYRPEVLDDDDLTELKNDKEFLLLKAISNERYVQSASKSKALFSWKKKRQITFFWLFMATHRMVKLRELIGNPSLEKCRVAD